jgi:hypothetical protein
MAKEIRFLGGSTPFLRTEFEERLKYKNLINLPGMIDTLYDQRAYGLINKNFEPVYLVNDQEVLSNFPNLADGVFCLNFVAAAFKNFRRDYTGRISNTNLGFPPFLDQVIPTAGHVPFEEAYSDYSIYTGVKYSTFLQNDTRINDYNCYLTAIKETFMQNLKSFPITRSGFLLSRHSNIRTSGLVLELANLDYNRDLEKGQIIQSQEFQCFIDYANVAGFYVDKFNPWRLYADLNSSAMASQIRRAAPPAAGEYNQNNDTEKVLNSIYRLRSQEDDLYDLQDFIIKTYNDIKKRVPFYTKTVYNNTSNTANNKSIFRPDINLLTAEEWLEMLLMVRLLELGRYTDPTFKTLKGSVLQNYRIYGTKQAIGRIGQICSQIIKENYEKGNSDTSTP